MKILLPIYMYSLSSLSTLLVIPSSSLYAVYPIHPTNNPHKPTMNQEILTRKRLIPTEIELVGPDYILHTPSSMQ